MAAGATGGGTHSRPPGRTLRDGGRAGQPVHTLAVCDRRYRQYLRGYRAGASRLQAGSRRDRRDPLDGAYATQANFKLMREALDQTSREVGRYVRLTNYCSGLCMPEIAAMGALERLDMMINDALYGII